MYIIKNLISVEGRKIVRKIPSSDGCIVWALEKEVIGTFESPHEHVGVWTIFSCRNAHLRNCIPF